MTDLKIQGYDGAVHIGYGGNIIGCGAVFCMEGAISAGISIDLNELLNSKIYLQLLGVPLATGVGAGSAMTRGMSAGKLTEQMKSGNYGSNNHTIIGFRSEW